MSNAIQRTATGKTPVTRLMRRLQARARRLLDDTAGVAALEFALLSPVMLAMLLGMLPMSLGLGEGGEQNAPLGRAVIGGLMVATFYTLFFVPVTYSLLRRKPPRHASDEDGT